MTLLAAVLAAPEENKTLGGWCFSFVMPYIFKQCGRYLMLCAVLCELGVELGSFFKVLLTAW